MPLETTATPSCNIDPSTKKVNLLVLEASSKTLYSHLISSLWLAAAHSVWQSCFQQGEETLSSLLPAVGDASVQTHPSTREV